jgi:hypothetical protein
MSDIAEVRERLGALDAKVTAAHSRTDKLETIIREDLKDIKKELHDLAAHMNRGKGWAAAMIFLAGSAGALVVKLLTMLKGV